MLIAKIISVQINFYGVYSGMVSVVILAHNKAAYTDVCLRSILETDTPDFELVVMNNGSSDRTAELLEELSQKFAAKGVSCKTLTSSECLGTSTARNQCVAEAAGDEVVFLDNDTVIPDAAWLEKLKRLLDSDPGIAIVGPKLCYPFEPHPIQCAGVGISRTGRVLFRGRGEPKDDPRFSKVEEVQTLTSACFMFRRSLYDEIGGLDEVFNPKLREM